MTDPDIAQLATRQATPRSDWQYLKDVFMAIAIKRIDRADRAHWVPLETASGYQLVNRAIPYPQRNLKSHATFVATLEEAGGLVEMGSAIRMAEPGSSKGDYIYPENLRIELL